MIRAVEMAVDVFAGNETIASRRDRTFSDFTDLRPHGWEPTVYWQVFTMLSPQLR